MRRELDVQMMQSLSAGVVSIDFTPSLASIVMPADAVKYEMLSVRNVAQHTCICCHIFEWLPTLLHFCAVQVTTNDSAQVIHARALKCRKSCQWTTFKDNKQLGARIEVLSGHVSHLEPAPQLLLLLHAA